MLSLIQVTKRCPKWAWQHKLRAAFFVVILLLIAYTITAIIVEHLPSPTDQIHVIDNDDKIAWMTLFDGQQEHATPIVLIHGAPANAGAWRRFAKELPSDFPAEVIALDRLGYGNSSSGRTLILEHHADGTESFLQTLPRKPIIVGHSYGGPVALAIAAHHPESIEGVVLVAGACDPYMQDAQNFRRFLNLLTPVIPTPWATANAELLALTDENQNLEPLLHRVVVPVTVIHGTRDMVCPHDGTVNYLERTLINSSSLEIKSIDGTGHNIHLSDPDLIAAELLELIRTLGEEKEKSGTPSIDSER